MPEHNTMIKDIGKVSLDFLVVLMYLMHSIQHTAIEEMNTRERAMFDQPKNSKNTIALLKNKVKEKE